MKLFVTGAAGFIGSHFIRDLPILCKNISDLELIVVDKLTYAGELGNLPDKKFVNYRFFKADIIDFDLMKSIMKGVDVVVHFAAESHVDNSILDSDPFLITNILGTNSLLKSAYENRVHKFIYVSTDEVYGSIDTGSWNESSQINPNSPYSASKASGEILSHAFGRTYGLHIISTRCGNNYGSHQHKEKLIPTIISKILSGQNVPIYGSGKNIREWIHVSDHVRAIWRLVEENTKHNVYNIGGNLGITNLEIASRILNLLGKDESAIEFVQDRKGHDFRYSLDSSRIQSEFGIKPRVTLNAGLRSTIEWYLENQKWLF